MHREIERVRESEKQSKNRRQVSALCDADITYYNGVKISRATM